MARSGGDAAAKRARELRKEQQKADKRERREAATSSNETIPAETEAALMEEFAALEREVRERPDQRRHVRRGATPDLRGARDRDRRRLTARVSDAGENGVERAGYPVQVEGFDHEPAVEDLPPRLGPDESPELILDRPGSLGRLALHDPERSQLALGLDDGFHSRRAQGSDHLFFEIRFADEEAQGLQTVSVEVRSEPRPLQSSDEIVLLGGITEPTQGDVETGRSVPVKEMADIGSPAHGYHHHTLGFEIAATAHGERFEGGAVAVTLHE